MQTKRQKLAKQILSGAGHDEIQEDVIGFFESLSKYLDRKYLDPEMVWADFGFYAIHWWSACKEYIFEERKRQGNDNTIFEGFGKLVDVLYETEAKHRKLSRVELEPGHDKITQFLKDESRLIRNRVLTENLLD